MNHTIIKVPAGKQFFELGELPRLFADAVPNPADTEETNFAVRLVMEQGRFWTLLKAAAEDGTLPVIDRYTRIRGPFPTNLNTKYLLVHIDDLREWARIKGFDVREKAEEQVAPGQATAAPAKHEAERPPEVEQPEQEEQEAPEQVESEGQEENSADAELAGLFDPVSVAALQRCSRMKNGQCWRNARPVMG